MIWDTLNSFISNATAYIHTLYSILPQSPIYVPAGIASDLATPLGYVAWFLPMSAMLAFFALYVIAISGWFIVIATLHFVEQITP